MRCRMPPTRRELLLGSGALFAWACAPRLARAEGRDPRLLTIVLRGALDGLAAVAPVGDPDWIKLRGDNALRLDGKTPALPLDGFFALNPAMPTCTGSTAPARRSSCTRWRRPIASARISTARTCWKAAMPGPDARTAAGSTVRLSRSHPASAVGDRRERASRLRGRTDHAAGGARPCAGAVVGAAAAAAGERRDHDASARYLSADRSDAGTRARGSHQPRRLRRSATSRTGVRRIWVRRCRSGTRRRCAPISRRPRVRRRSSWRSPTVRASARSRSTAGTPTSTRARSTAGCRNLLGALDAAIAAIETNMGGGLERDRGGADHRVRPHRAHQRQRRHRPRHRRRSRCWPAVRSRAAGSSPTGRASRRALSIRTATCRPTTDLRAVLKGLLRDHLRVDDRALDDRHLSRQRRGKADRGPARLMQPPA